MPDMRIEQAVRMQSVAAAVVDIVALPPAAADMAEVDAAEAAPKRSHRS